MVAVAVWVRLIGAGDLREAAGEALAGWGNRHLALGRRFWALCRVTRLCSAGGFIVRFNGCWVACGRNSARPRLAALERRERGRRCAGDRQAGYRKARGKARRGQVGELHIARLTVEALRIERVRQS